MKRVYFIKPVGLPGPVKIGCSIEPIGRLRVICSWSPIPLEIVGTIEGGHDVENAIHHRFAYLAMHGEWFAIDAELQSFLDDVVAGRDFDLSRDNGSTVNRRIAGIKISITRTVSETELRVFGHRLQYGLGRPAHIRAILDALKGPDAAPPSPSEQLALAQYVTELRSRPAFCTDWQKRFDAWKEYRDGPLGFFRPESAAA